MNFIGRINEINELNILKSQPTAKLAVIYGRRRVGKSRLVEEIAKGEPCLTIEGIEGAATAEQIKNVCKDLFEQTHDELLKHANFEDWRAVFSYLVQYIDRFPEKKFILFFDEFPWLAAKRTLLVSLFKSYWDRYFSKRNVFIVVCGSIATFMVKRVIKSKALYGRISYELRLEPLLPNEQYLFLKEKRGINEAIGYALTLGGIPKYLNEINLNLSFQKNLNRLLFTKNGILIKEFEKIFYSQFREPKTYEEIVKVLKDGPLSLQEIATKMKLKSSGGLKSYLENLEYSSFIATYVPFDKELSSKLKKYKLTDEYLRFYFSYIDPHLKTIDSNTTSRDLFQKVTEKNWNIWCGFSFESFCQKYAIYLADKMGFVEEVESFGPIFHRTKLNSTDRGFQVDLAYKRFDKIIVLCEIKYYSDEVTTKVIPAFQAKCDLMKVPRGYTLEKALIAPYGAHQSVIETNFFHHILTLEDIFRMN